MIDIDTDIDNDRLWPILIMSFSSVELVLARSRIFSYTVTVHHILVCRLPPDVPAHNILQHCVNLSQGRCPALTPTGSVHLVGQGRPGYNRWKRITSAQSTRCGHRRRIARCGGRYTALAGQAQQWVLHTTVIAGDDDVRTKLIRSLLQFNVALSCFTFSLHFHLNCQLLFPLQSSDIWATYYFNYVISSHWYI